MRLDERLDSIVRDVLAPSVAIGNTRRAALYRRLGIEVGERTVLTPNLSLWPGEVTIGQDCFINRHCVFDPGSASIVIEDGVTLGVGVVLAANTHEIGPTEKRARGNKSSSIRIGRGSWLGARVVVLPGRTVARGCILGAGAVLTRDTSADGVYVGVPARRVRDLPSS